jgi:hypothetical protein
MLTALEGPRHRAQMAQVQPIPIPVNGWSTRDKYTASFSRAALRYSPFTRNWMWVDGRITVRPGFSEWATDMTDPVQSLMEYSGPDGTRELFAATFASASGCKLWDVTSNDAATEIDDGLTSAQWQHTMFATTSGNYLWMCNGADAIKAYDGSSWTEPSITGVTGSNIIHVCNHKGRLWLVEKETLNAWYLAPFAISGAASKFPLGQLASKGGSLMAIASWSIDGGNGPDDMIAFITTEGQVIIYHGLDPNTTSDWGLVGVYAIDKPISRRCVIKFGADLVIFTESGPVQLSQVLANPDPRDTLADPIRDEYIAAVTSYRSQFGWEISYYTRRGWIFVNLPRSASGESTARFEQYVFNPLMKAWFRFTELNGSCWCQSGNAMYFGGVGSVYIWDNNDIDDNGDAVVADISFPWWSYGSGNKKQFSLIRPHFFTDGEVVPFVEMKVEYDETDPTAQAESTVAPTGAEWDDEEWDAADWSGGIVPYREWLTASGEGTVAAPRIKVSNLSASISLTQIDVAYVDGGII